MPIPNDYAERVYAGVLGKLIGVYLGRPVEQWSPEQIAATVGAVWYYLAGRSDLALPPAPLVVADDDLSGTFTFLRALADNGYSRTLTPAQIGQTWLNYIVEGKAILWWGGMGHSTEHTAFLRLRAGYQAPASGSAALNGQVVAEQIGAQIFIDGWAMVAPGDPALAADLARRAASVSHDGAAVHAAQLLAAMEAQAFVEHDLERLLACGLAHIPRDAPLARLVADLREWRAAEADWRAAHRRLVERYGYARYGGGCHVIPNHALIHLALLYGADDFQRAMMIVTTAGYDTDCNAGNLGCLLGIRGGLATFEGGPDWRGPVADRLYLPTADGGRCVTDALREAYAVVNAGRALAGMPPEAPKGGARFHFSLPGSVQGFQATGQARLELANQVGPHGERCLAMACSGLGPEVTARAATATFIPPEDLGAGGYELLASPSLYAGQTLTARLLADGANHGPVSCRLVVQTYGPGDRLVDHPLAGAILAPGADVDLRATLPDTAGDPVATVGVELVGAGAGRVFLDRLSWAGAPALRLAPPDHDGTVWRRAWVCAVDRWSSATGEPYRLIQDRGRGLLIQGAREWADYAVEARVRPHMAAAAGVAARVQGLERYYALLRVGATLRLVKALDGERTLAELPYAWPLDEPRTLRLEVVGDTVAALVDGNLIARVSDAERPLDGGGVALVVAEGRVGFGEVRVEPAGGG